MNTETAPATVAGFTQTQLDAAVASATATATKAGAEAERARISAIVKDPAAKGREPAALSLALDTAISAAEAIKVLATLPITASIPARAQGLPEIGVQPGGQQPAAKEEGIANWGIIAKQINDRKGHRA